MDLQEVLLRLLKAQIEIGSSVILWREIIGNGFGLASALLGMWRKVAAWPVGIVGNVLLFTVFVGTAIGGPVRHSPEAGSVGPGRPPDLLHHRQRVRLGALVSVPEVARRERASAYAPSGRVRVVGCSCWSAPWL